MAIVHFKEDETAYDAKHMNFMLKQKNKDFK